MTILITGATGLVGHALGQSLIAQGHRVNYLTTRQDKIVKSQALNGYFWNPAAGHSDREALQGVTTIVNLAGASVADRWTPEYKQKIVESRLLSCRLLYKMLHDIPHQVQQFVGASATGVYEDNTNLVHTEHSEAFDDGFLATVVCKWESAADSFEKLGLKVAKIRTGLVLSDKGGMLGKMLPPAKWGASAALGNGRQWQSWIHIRDLVRVYTYVIERELGGTFNATAPHPVTNQQMTAAIAKALKKPYFLPGIPEFVLKAALGEMSEMLLSSQKVLPKKLLDSGFSFEFADVDAALEDLIGK